MPLSQYRIVADTIVSKIAQVANAGRVYAYQRSCADSAKLKNLCLDTKSDRIATWMVSRSNRVDLQSANVTNTITHQFKLFGYMSVKDEDETELIFQQVVNDICEKFRPQSSLSGIVELIEPVQVDNVAYIMFADVLCHYAECRLVVQEHISS